MSVLAIIPARGGSKGIPLKNVKPLGGRTPLNRAMLCAIEAGLPKSYVVVTTDMLCDPAHQKFCTIVRRPPELAQDDTPMIAVVQHVLAQIPGPPDQKIVLLQPTQPLREPKHITQALELLTPEVDSVVSVVETVSLDELLFISHWNQFRPEEKALYVFANGGRFASLPARRQEMRKGYRRDGTAYAFRRRTVERYGNMYGERVSPLIIPPSETCPLDTPEDWAEAERRLKERER